MAKVNDLDGGRLQIDISLRYEFDVFLSYSTSQQADALRLYRALEARQLRTFYAPETLQADPDAPGQYVEALQAALLQSVQVVVLLSRTYLDSAWCLLEMHGAFARIGREKPRRLWIWPLEPVEDELPGQLVPFIFHGSSKALVDAIAQVKAASDVHIGDHAAEPGDAARMFVELPLRERYEPPEAGNPPPWAMDYRSPGGLPGAPPYEVYELLVREYMVQIMRGRKPGRLEIPGFGSMERFAWISDRAEQDARYMLALKISPFQRPYTRSLGDWLRDIRNARQQGQDPAKLDCLEGAALIDAGASEEGIRLIRRALAENPELAGRDGYLIKAALGAYLQKDFSQALELLDTLSGPLPEDARLIRDATLARLGQLSTQQRQKNRESDVSIADIRIDSELERRSDLDYLAEGLRLAGYPA